VFQDEIPYYQRPKIQDPRLWPRCSRMTASQASNLDLKVQLSVLAAFYVGRCNSILAWPYVNLIPPLFRNTLPPPPHTELRTRQNKQATNGGKLVKQFTKLPANERTNPMAVNWETTNPLPRQPANRQVQSSKRLKCHKNQHSHTHVRVCA